MRLGYVELFVADPRRSKRFYADLLGFEVISEPPDGMVVWLKLQDHVVLLRPSKPDRPRFAAYGDMTAAFVLYRDDLDRTMDDLRRRGLEFGGTDGSPRCPTFTDPDGNWIQLVNPAEH